MNALLLRIEKVSAGPVSRSLFSEGLVVQVVPSDPDSRMFDRGCGYSTRSTMPCRHGGG